ncbi:hypothetical protein HDU86_000095 [Geranomyces michiganensis]|nr:hypothetical protein HDU86_000095 [Geranomyces michiganensis]
MLITSAFTVLLAAGAATAQVAAPPAKQYGLLKNVRSELSFAPYTPAQKDLVVQQVHELFQVYAHEYVKIQDYHIDAQAAIEKVRKTASSLSLKDFNYKMASIFLSLRDFHTNYNIGGKHACYGFVTPFKFNFVDSHDIAQDPRIVVESLTVVPEILALTKDQVSRVHVGDTLEKIDGLTFREHWLKTQSATGGANQFGGYRAALSLLSSANGKIYPAPEKDTITFELRRPGAYSNYKVTVPYVAVGKKQCLAEAPGAAASFTAPKFHGPNLAQEKKKGPVGVKPTSPLDGMKIFGDSANDLVYKKTDSNIINWTIYKHGGANLGVLQLTDFQDDTEADGLGPAIEVFQSLLLNELAETDSIVIDLRDNGGGIIAFADVLPQLFVPNFVPGTARALRTENNRVLMVENSADGPIWAASYNQSRPGDRYTAPASFSTVEQDNAVGQLYLRPIGVLTNANCYVCAVRAVIIARRVLTTSSCDMFSASMQDFGVTVFGEDGTTGAGGANVVEHRSFLQPAAPTIFKPLPFQDVDANGTVRLGAPDFRVAWRQSLRVNKNKGVLIEDRGVLTDVVVRPTVADFTTSNSTGKSTQFDKIAAALKKEGKNGKAGLFFQSPLANQFAVTGSAVSFPYSSQLIKKLQLRDSSNKVVGEVSPSPYYRRTSGKINTTKKVTDLGYFAYNIRGYNANGKQVLTTNRVVTVTPALDKYVKVAAGSEWTYTGKTPASAAFSAVYNLNSPAIDGWQISPSTTGVVAVVGNGIQYVDNTDTDLRIFANVPKGGAKLATKFTFDTEKNYDYFTISVRSVVGVGGGSQQQKPVTLFRESGKGAVDQTFDLPPGNLDISFRFVSDNGVDEAGVTISKITIKA